tara:strand:+ start:4056 stop:4550 length:495 start_codon:yes stop_codon:yes gene_type:complete
MTIIVKNKETLFFNDFTFKCAIGKKGKTKNKVEGDKKTPQGYFSLGNLYYRRDRNSKPKTKIKCIPIKKNMGWCDDPKDPKNYNKLIKIKSKIKCEKIYRKDNKYDFLLPINYNKKKTVLGKGSAIFIHLTSNYNSTLGCITLKKKDFLILLKLIKKKTKIRIY